MSIFKRGKFYWYKFMWDGKLIRESTKQGNDKIARNMESAHRTALAQGLVGIREKKTVPTLEEFSKNRIEPWAKATFQKPAPKTWLWYCFGLKSLRGYKKLANLKLDEIGNEVQHKNAIKESKVRPFVIYSFRHTFLTRLGESGCDAWTLARIAGHSNIAISQRYVHPSGDAVLLAMSRLGGHNTGHTEKTTLPAAEENQAVTGA